MRALDTLAALALLPLVACHQTPTQPGQQPMQVGTLEASASVDDVAPDLTRARGLYSDHCALCHGERGEGDGEAAHLLYPPARDFTLGFFRLASTENSVPTDDDLRRTLRRGMPGSAMPPFAWMPEHDLRDLATLVREFARDGLLGDLYIQALDDGSTLPEAEAEAIVDRWLTPGESIEALPPRDANLALLSHGRKLYFENCAVCHGLDGGGRGGAPKRHEDGSLTWARDFTAGILKGGGSRFDLTCRIRAGMGGSAMPPSDLSESDMIALVAYVENLIPTGAPARHQQLRTQIVARRIQAAPTAADWNRAKTQELHMAPLAWHDESVLDVSVSALHDNDQLWVRLRWMDETRSDQIVGGAPYVDAAAIQLTTAAAPPLFGMGAEGTPVNLWHWSSARWNELAGLLDPFEGVVHSDQIVIDETGGRPDVPHYQGAPDAEGAIALESEGFRVIHPRGGSLGAEATWADGAWELVLSRQLRQEQAGEINLVPGRTLQIGVAIWNGAAGDNRGQKSITIWHELQLER